MELHVDVGHSDQGLHPPCEKDQECPSLDAERGVVAIVTMCPGQGSWMGPSQVLGPRWALLPQDPAGCC